MFVWGEAKKPGSLYQGGGIYAILKIRFAYVSGPNGKNIENIGSEACSPKIDNIGP